MINPMQSVFVTAIDWGVRFPVTLFNSYGRFYYLNRPNELIHILERKFNVEIDEIMNSIPNLSKKKKPKAIKRMEFLGNAKDKFLAPIYEQMSDYIIQLCPPLSILALEDQAYFHTLDSYNGKSLNYWNGNNRMQLTEEWCHKIRLKILVNMLYSKAPGKNIEVMLVDPYNTSCTCPRCGRVNHDNRNKSKHIYCCDKCGLVCNDDGVAAWNIHNFAYRRAFNRDFVSTIDGRKTVVLQDSKPRPLR